MDVQRRELLRRLRDAQRAAMAEPDGSDAALLLEGVVLRLQADLRWLEACEQSWTDRGADRERHRRYPVLRARGRTSTTALETDWCAPSTESTSK